MKEFKKEDELNEEKEYLINKLIEIVNNYTDTFKEMLNKLDIDELYLIMDMLEDKEDGIPDRVMNSEYYKNIEIKAYSISKFFNVLINSGIKYEDVMILITKYIVY